MPRCMCRCNDRSIDRLGHDERTPQRNHPAATIWNLVAPAVQPSARTATVACPGHGVRKHTHIVRFADPAEALGSYRVPTHGSVTPDACFTIHSLRHLLRQNLGGSPRGELAQAFCEIPASCKCGFLMHGHETNWLTTSPPTFSTCSSCHLLATEIRKRTSHDPQDSARPVQPRRGRRRAQLLCLDVLPLLPDQAAATAHPPPPPTAVLRRADTMRQPAVVFLRRSSQPNQSAPRHGAFV